ncbi:MAG: hypothetical protein R3300_09025 [Candidatus Promineifilaceae bacterium]|nr:hypothetical protein [Candidatus Promineifilaceae bacterium]
MKDSPLPDMYDKIEKESSSLANLVSKIPGFQGYIERSRRREADQLLRQTIAARLEETRLQLSAVQQELSRDIVKAIEYAEPIGRADTKLVGLIGKIRDAPQGYAGFFDAVKVREEDLARIYDFDETMLAEADEIAADVDALEKATREDGDIGAQIKELDDTLRQANSVFNSRQEVISDVEQVG